MGAGIFGPRGPSYSYYPTRYASPYHRSYPTSYTTSYTNQNYSAYPCGYLTPSVSPVYYGQIQEPLQNFNYSFSWNTPRIIVPPKGLEIILIATLMLVVLDQIFIRPLKTAQ